MDLSSTTTQLVLIPGLLCDKTVFEPLIASLDKKTNVLVPSLLEQQSIGDMARHVWSQSDEHISLLGFSMGARVALEMYNQCPDRIERLALLDTGVHPLKDGELVSRKAAVDRANQHGMAALAAQWLPPMLGLTQRQNQSLMQSLTDMVIRHSAEVHEQQIEALVTRPDALPVLHRITCPTLIGVGREDQWSPVAQHEQMHKVVSNSTLHIFEDAGHFALLENPDAVNSAVQSWLQQR